MRPLHALAQANKDESQRAFPLFVKARVSVREVGYGTQLHRTEVDPRAESPCVSETFDNNWIPDDSFAVGTASLTRLNFQYSTVWFISLGLSFPVYVASDLK